MTFVIAEPCVGTCDTACVSVCPVDCIHGPVSPAELQTMEPTARAARVAGLQMLIDPETCTCCGACATQCPVSAIFEEDELPSEWRRYRQLAIDFYR
jgi:NAD-dependent dihydropyrimidine dehydrogenase PreA subunit